MIGEVDEWVFLEGDAAPKSASHPSADGARPSDAPAGSHPALAPSAQHHTPLLHILHLPPWANLQVMHQQVSAKVHQRRKSVGGRHRGRPPQAGTSREQPRSPNPAASTICTPSTLEVTQGQILSQSSTDATSSR